jgi:hypothetical protein
VRKLALVLLAVLPGVKGTCEATELGITGTQFTVNNKPTFLVGISYYGALGAPKDFILRDLDEMQRSGFNWFRVWATWSGFENDVAAIDHEGKAREPFLQKLRWLIEECDRRRMVVDVTLHRGDGRLEDTQSLKRAVETLLLALKSYRNWYLDLANERNIRDARYVSFEELVAVRRLAKRLDLTRLVTASHAGDVTKEELRRYLKEVEVDFIAPHRPRHAESPKETAARTREYLEWMREMGRVVPVHYQEPFRRGYSPRDWEPKAEDFLMDLKGAKEGGAAGWCLHNGEQKDRPEGKPRRSFDMRGARLFDQLDEEEKEFIERMGK